MFKRNYCKAVPWRTAFDEPKDDPTPDPKPDPTPKPKTFTQEEVNKFLADDRRRHQASNQKMLDELEALKAKADLTQSERTELEVRLEDLQNQLLTKEELAEKERIKLEEKSKKDIETLQKQLGDLQGRYQTETINRAITDAAASHKAFNPSQIIAILRPLTRLEEVEDENGNINHLPKVKFPTIDKNKKPIVLDLTVSEAVKNMTEIEDYSNLFISNSQGGMGGNRRPSGKQVDIREVAKDPEKYREMRKKQGAF